jgi:hypothetical protein
MSVTAPIVKPILLAIWEELYAGRGGVFSPASLSPTAWYDPSDMSTLFQDSAGSTPVTAVEQPVGRISDKSGNGRHATQATTSLKPTYSARKNELTYTQDLTQWGLNGRQAGIFSNRVYKPHSDI